MQLQLLLNMSNMWLPVVKAYLSLFMQKPEK